MATDPRIEKYREAAVAMQRGEFDVEIPAGDEDDVAELGCALLDLARSFESRFEEFDRLAEITERINAGLILEEVLDFVFDSFGPIIPYDRIGLALLDQGGRQVRARWARSNASALKIEQGYAAPMKGSSLARILETGKPRILNDLEAYLREHPQSDSTRRVVEEGMRSSLTCPLIARGRPVGFLFFSSMRPGTYGAVHQGLFRKIAGQLSVIIEKGRLYQELVELNRQLVRAQSDLEHQASHDPLTDLWNRAAILRLLEKDLARAEREERPIAAVMTDLDHFKEVNDEHGHLNGDDVLRETARRLAAGLRSSEDIGRYGGEEFLVILYPCDEATASRVMERLRTAVGSRPILTRAGPLDVTISLGAAVAAPGAGLAPEAMIRCADQALYRAKEGGRNRHEVSAALDEPE